MKRFYEKLKSRRGASMIFALIVFLMCVLAGTAALTAASANIGRYSRLENEQRQYFSAASALELLQSRLNARMRDDPVQVTVTYTETETWWYESIPAATPGDPPTYELHTETKSALDVDPAIGNFNYYQYLLVENCIPAGWRSAWDVLKTAVPLSVRSGFEKNYTVDLDRTGGTLPEWADSVKKVSVKVKSSNAATDAKFNLEMELTTDDDGAYPLKVVWPGEAVTTTKTETTTTGGDPSDPTSADKGTRTTTTTLTCTVRWSAEDRVVSFKRDD